MYYVVVDIGCIECGESSHVLGVFTDKNRAKEICEKAKEKEKKFAALGGQHDFEIFEVDKIDKVILEIEGE